MMWSFTHFSVVNSNDKLQVLTSLNTTLTYKNTITITANLT